MEEIVGRQSRQLGVTDSSVLGAGTQTAEGTAATIAGSDRLSASSYRRCQSGGTAMRKVRRAGALCPCVTLHLIDVLLVSTHTHTHAAVQFLRTIHSKHFQKSQPRLFTHTLQAGVETQHVCVEKYRAFDV